MSRWRLLFSLAPLVAFTVVEAWWSLTAGVVVAMVFAVGELAWVWLTERRIHRVVLASCLLVLGLGGLSLLSQDERFVLWTPVIGDLLFSAVLAGSFWRGTPLLELAMREQAPDLELDPDEKRFFAGVTWRLALNLLLHAAVTAWSTTQDRPVWLFVSGPLQYVQLGVQLVGEYWWMQRVLPPLEE